MGGKGSGRLSRTDTILRNIKVNPIIPTSNEPMILPNHSGIMSHPETKKSVFFFINNVLTLNAQVLTLDGNVLILQ